MRRGFRKSDGRLGATNWRMSEKFEIIKVVNVDFLTHKTGERFIRFPPDLFIDYGIETGPWPPLGSAVELTSPIASLRPG